MNWLFMLSNCNEWPATVESNLISILVFVKHPPGTFHLHFY